MRRENPRTQRPTSVARLLVLVIGTVGCQLPRVFDEPKPVVVYDTAAGRGDTPGPLTDELTKRYGETLAEPVAITRANVDGVTWGVLFATNRTADPHSVGTVPIYGECLVDLPRRPRGTLAVKSTNALGGILPVSFTQKSTPRAHVQPASRLEPDTFHSRLRERVDRSTQRDVLLFVHGFNVDFDSAIARAAQLGNDVPFNGAIVAYSWPSRAKIDGYLQDERIVADSVPAFREFVTRLRSELPTDARLHIVVHSMGNRLVLGALSEIEAPAGRKPFENVVLAAPDVGIGEFADRAEHLVQLAERVTLYVCETDNALVASKKLHGEQRIGDARPPVIVPGVETIDATAIDTSLLGHSYYGDNAGVLIDLFHVLKEGRRADDREWLRRVGPDDGPGHWVFDETPPEVQWVWHLDDAG